MSKYLLKVSDIYLKDSDVPINKLGIENKDEIHELERELLDEAFEIFQSELDENTLFDEQYYKELHRRTFEPLYEWAGVYRDFDMAKGDSVFCRGQYVSSESKKIFDTLAKDDYFKYCDDTPKEEFAAKLAKLKCDLIALHPFYELNGRITRLFFDLIAVYNGYLPIDYQDFASGEYIEASIECVMYANDKPMEKIILNGLQKVGG